MASAAKKNSKIKPARHSVARAQPGRACAAPPCPLEVELGKAPALRLERLDVGDGVFVVLLQLRGRLIVGVERLDGLLHQLADFGNVACRDLGGAMMQARAMSRQPGQHKQTGARERGLESHKEKRGTPPSSTTDRLALALKVHDVKVEDFDVERRLYRGLGALSRNLEATLQALQHLLCVLELQREKKKPKPE